LTISPDNTKVVYFADRTSAWRERDGTGNVRLRFTERPTSDIMLALTSADPENVTVASSVTISPSDVDSTTLVATVPFFQIVNDNVYEDNESVAVSFTVSSPADWNAGRSTHYVRIHPSDNRPGTKYVGFETPGVRTILEGSGQGHQAFGYGIIDFHGSEFPIESGAELLFEYLHADGTDASDEIVHTQGAVLTKATLPRTVRGYPIQAKADDDDEGDETILFRLKENPANPLPEGWKLRNHEVALRILDPREVRFVFNPALSADPANSSRPRWEIDDDAGTASFELVAVRPVTEDIELTFFEATNIEGFQLRGEANAGGTKVVFPRGATRMEVVADIADIASDAEGLLEVAGVAGIRIIDILTGNVADPQRQQILVAVNDSGGISGTSNFTFSAPADNQISEGGNTTLALNLGNTLTAEAELRIDITGTGIDGDDFTITSSDAGVSFAPGTGGGILTIPNGATSPVTLTVTAGNDNDPEINEVATFTLNGTHADTRFPGGWSVDPSENISESITILADDNLVQFASASSTAAEGVGSHNVAVEVNMPHPSEVITLNFTASDGTALNGSDYTVTGTSVMVSANSGTANIPVSIIDDSIGGEESETFTLTLDTSTSLPEGWDFGSQTTRTVTITDNDPDETIGFAVASETFNEPATDSSGSTGSAHNVEIQLSATPTVDLPVVFAFTGDADRDTGAITEDYSSMERHTIEAADVDGNMKANYRLSILADEEHEHQETFTITFAETQPDLPSGWVIDNSNRTFTGTIRANDNTITFANPSSASISEDGGTATIAATINREIPASTSAADRTITITPSGDAVIGTDYRLSVPSNSSQGTLANNGNTWTWTLPEGADSGTMREAQLTVTAVDNDDDEADKSFTLEFEEGNLLDGWDVTDVTHTITITDDDETQTIGFTDRVSNAPEVASNMTYSIPVTVVGTPASELTLTIDVDSTASNAATRDTDFTVGTLTIPTSGSAELAVVILQDDAPESDETIALEIDGTTLSGSGFILGANTTHTITIPANDRFVGFSSGSHTTTEAAGHYDLILTLNDDAPAAGLPLEITVSGDPDSEVTLSATSNATLTSGNTFTVNAASRTATLRIAFSADSDFIQDVYTLNFAEPSSGFPSTEGWGIRADSTSFALTVNDPRPGVLQFAAVPDTSAVEPGTASMDYVVNIMVDGTPPAPGSAFNLTVDAAGNATVSDGDYTVSPSLNAVPFSSDEVTSNMLPLTFSILADSTPEDVETIELTLQDPGQTGWVLGTKTTHTISIAANENIADFATVNPSSVRETAGSVNLNIAITNPAPSPNGLDLVIAATSGVTSAVSFVQGDFSAPKSYNFKIPANHDPSMPYSVPVYIQDGVDGEDDNVTFTLTQHPTTFPTGWGSVPSNETLPLSITEPPVVVSGTVEFDEPTSTADEPA
ncbi:MAG: hypothetical protein OXF05_05055, partial [Hyphomicrobiales bacterium]|nr:hypothetical protein [Hyphomicrobiales bacterium]